MDILLQVAFGVVLVGVVDFYWLFANLLDLIVT